MSVQPFQVQVAANVLDDLRERLAKTRWPDQIEGAGWDYGTNLDYVKELAEYWQNSFDWQKQQDYINTFHNFRTDIDGLNIHFVHERGKGPNPMPLIITHGWPSSFYEILELVARLTDPAKYGGKAEDSFDVVVPSIPGYGFSDRPNQPGMNRAKIADIWAKLMTEELRYQKFMAQGGDVGSGITEQLALNYSDKLLGIHLTNTPYQRAFQPADQPSPAEQKYLEKIQQWAMTDGAYAMIQSTRPQTLAYGLNDSPAGLAAWIVEKFRAWSDSDGEVEKSFSKDQLLGNITIYWATQTINSSNRLYHESEEGTATGKVSVPTAFGIFPKDIVPPPRDWANRFYNVQRWTKMPRGGHFASSEEPDLLAEDIRAFARTLR